MCHFQERLYYQHQNDVRTSLQCVMACKYAILQSANQPFTRNVTRKLLVAGVFAVPVDAIAPILHIIQRNCPFSAITHHIICNSGSFNYVQMYRSMTITNSRMHFFSKKMLRLHILVMKNISIVKIWSLFIIGANCLPKETHFSFFPSVVA